MPTTEVTLTNGVVAEVTVIRTAIEVPLLPIPVPGPSMTGAEIKEAYEAEPNTNAFTDAEKTVVANQSGINTGDQDLSDFAEKNNVLELDNQAPYTPTEDYHPATKKFVEDSSSGGEVSSVFGRTGDVVAQPGDYNAAQVGADPVGSAAAVQANLDEFEAFSPIYIQSRGQNLITNGSGLLFNNYNFPDFTFDQTETAGGGGSFLSDEIHTYRESKEFIPVDTSKRYRWVAFGKAGDDDGGNYDPNANQLAGISLLDIDRLTILPIHTARVSTAIDTTLAVDLNPGDTTITLTDATGWYNGGDSTPRGFVWYGYTNSYGYTYPDYTYTRNYSGADTWAENGIAGNVITLNSPWAGPSLTAGDAVRNAQPGGGYKYFVNATNVPQTWTRYENYIKPETGDSVERLNDFRSGTAFIRLLFIPNRFSTQASHIRWSLLSFSEISSDNLEPASSALQGVVSLEDQVLGDGKKFFQEDIAVGHDNPTARVHAKGPTSDSSAYIRKEEDSSGNLRASLRCDGEYYHDGPKREASDYLTTSTVLTNSSRVDTLVEMSLSGQVLSFPASPADDEERRGRTTGGFSHAIDPNGKLINGSAGTVNITPGQSWHYKYKASTGSWWSWG